MPKIVKGLSILVVVAGAAVAGYAWLSGPGSDGNGLKQVEIARGSITEKALAIGRIEPRLKFEVKSKISGIVQNSYFEVGDAVRAGEVLFDIVPDPTPAELSEAQRAVELAQAAYDRAEADYERAQDLANEFLPHLLGRGALGPYRGYRPDVNAGIANVFAAAAYRVGHSMLSPRLLRLWHHSTYSAAATTGCRATTRCASTMGWHRPRTSPTSLRIPTSRPHWRMPTPRPMT